MRPPISSREQAKAYARQLRFEHARRNQPISHSAALEKVALALGYKDWNTLSARLSNKPERPLQVGDRVEGQYLKQPMTGYVKAVSEIGSGQAFDVVIVFDEPVDVVQSKLFSNHRSQIKSRISPEGLSHHKTSDGVPHLIVSRAISDALCV